jgi:hypothetical protein
MITTGISPLGINWNVIINDSPVDARHINRVTIDYAENTHDIATVDFVGTPSVIIADYLDKPVAISMVVGGGIKQSFFGYIKNIDAISLTSVGLIDASPFQTMRAVCFGASYFLKETNNRIWTNVTLNNIIQQLANPYRFSYSVPEDSFKFSRVVQNQNTNWEFLVKVCNQLGYRVSCHGAHIHVWDPLKALAHQPSYTVIRGLIGKNKNYNPSPGDILKFEPVIGTHTISGTNTTNSVSYITPEGTIGTVSDSDLYALGTYLNDNPTQTNQTLSINAQSHEMAQRIVKTEKLNQSFSYHARAEIMSDPSIIPGGIVKVEGYGNNFDGYWYVNKVVHELVSESMISNLSLSKNTPDEDFDKFPKVRKYRLAPEPILLNNRWVAQTEYADVYS